MITCDECPYDCDEAGFCIAAEIERNERLNARERDNEETGRTKAFKYAAQTGKPRDLENAMRTP